MNNLVTTQETELVKAAESMPPILDGHYSPAVQKKTERFYLSVDQMFEAWIAKNSNRNTQRSYRAAITGLIQFMGIVWPEESWRLLTVSVDDIQAWRDHLENVENKAPATLNHRICMASAFYTFMRETATELRLPIQVPNLAHRDFIERPTTKSVDENEALTIVQVQRLLRMPNTESLADYRDRAIIAFYAFTGARIGTGCRLEAHDFIMDEKSPKVKIQEKGKKKTKRPMKIHDTAAHLLHEYRMMAEIESGPFFWRKRFRQPPL